MLNAQTRLESDPKESPGGCRISSSVLEYKVIGNKPRT